MDLVVYDITFTIFSMFSWSWLRSRSKSSHKSADGAESVNGATDSDDVTGAPGSERPGERPTTSKHYGNFSEAEILDSGMGRSLHSALPAANVEEDLDSIQHDPLFAEEFLLAKLQEAQRQLQHLREYRKAIEAGGDVETNGKSASSGSVRRRGDMMIVASFRVPLAVEVDASGEVSSSMATGGLGLLPSFRQLWNRMPVRWLGLAALDGGVLSKEQCEKIKTSLMNNAPKTLGFLRFSPLFLDPEITLKHQKFCNSVLWPLFHYLPPSLEGDRCFDSEVYDGYVQVNKAYADAMMKEFEDSGAELDDVVFWIQDFHLLLVPHMLRTQLRTARIGFFLHTPFPAWELFRNLAPRRDILRGMLAADLIGFHNYDYARHFIDSSSLIMGLETRPNGVYNHGIFAHVSIFPFGIDTDTFRGAMKKSSVVQIREKLLESFNGKKVVIGIDRLDYVKGIPHKLLAVEYFLENNVEWIGKFVLLQVAIPSKTKSKSYQRFRSEILEMVGRINGRFGTLEDMPIHYLEKELSFDHLCALYSIADIALITSIRDGMNLVSYEYVACQQKKKGVLIISEFTGAAQNLPGALMCNPWNAEEVAELIKTSLLMSETERKLRYRKLYQYILLHSSAQWGTNFYNDLLKYSTKRAEDAGKLVSLPIKDVVASYREARKRLVLLDYDGTIRDYETQPELAEPTEKLASQLKALSSDPKNIVFIVSGREEANLESWFGELQVGLAAEHGFSIKWPRRQAKRIQGLDKRSISEKVGERLNGVEDVRNDNDEQSHLPDGLHQDNLSEGWIKMYDNHKLTVLKHALKKAAEALKQIETFTPTTFISEKESAVSWHFRDANPDFAMSRVHDAKQALDQLLKKSPMEVLRCPKILHVRPQGVNKGVAVQTILKGLKDIGESPDWVLVVGDDRTDEQMFQTVQNSVLDSSSVMWICTVERKVTTKANYYLRNVREVLNLLDQLTTGEMVGEAEEIAGM